MPILSIGKLKNSFQNAFRGVKLALSENTFRIFIAFTLVIVFALLYLPLTPAETAVIILTMAVMLSLELINSQIERILDILKPEYSEEIRKIKDISAGAVLLASIGAAIIGIIILGPLLLEKL